MDQPNEDLEPNEHLENEEDDDEDESRLDKVLNIKPVKTNKARWVNRDRLAGLPASEDPLVMPGKTVRVKRIFSDQKPMKVCDICGNQYKYQHALDSHMRRHRNDKPFTCRWVLAKINLFKIQF